MIEERVEKCFQRVFSRPSLSIKPEQTAHDIPGWDSLANINLIVEIENEFGFRFSASDVIGLQNVGELLGVIRTKVQ